MSTPIPDLYQVKWFVGFWRYGIVDRWSPESQQYYVDSRRVIVNDALTPYSGVVSVDNLVPIESKFNPLDEYARYVEDTYLAAKNVSDCLPDGVHKGKLFRVPCGDGYAYYIVTKVNKKTVDIEWRGYCLDRWVDERFGYGGREKRDVIEALIRREDGMKRLFRREPATNGTS